MRFRFVGQYTGQRDSINCGSVTFYGNDAAEVEDEALIERLRKNPEFEVVKGRPPAEKAEETPTEAENPPAERETLALAGPTKARARKVRQ